MTRKLFISNTIVVVMAVLGLAYLSLVLVDVNPLRDDTTVVVELAETGGLFGKSEVTYRGKSVGKIREIRPRAGGIEVEVALEEGTQIPVDTRVVVGGLSAIGEQTLDFRPRTASGPFLTDGARVPQSATTLPVPFHRLIGTVDDLVSQIDTRDLRTILDAAYVGTNGAGPELSRLIGDSQGVVGSLREVLPETQSLLRDGARTLETADALTRDFKAFSASARTLTRQLRAGEPLLRRLMVQTPPTIETLLNDVQELTPATARLLGHTSSSLGILGNRIPALSAFLTSVPIGASSVADSIYDGVLHAVGDFAPAKVCYYDGAEVGTPWIRSERPPVLDRFCARYAPDLQQRGSYYAPR